MSVRDRMCVKSLIDKAAIEPITDDDANLNNFCNVMEHIMLHRNEGTVYCTAYCSPSSN